MLHVIQSNKMEVLQAQIIQKLVYSHNEQTSLLDALKPETLIVQSPGMAQWLKIHIAQVLGIAANIEFPLPSSFIWKQYQRHFDDLPETSAFTKANMTWKLMAILPGYLAKSEFAEIRQYLQGDDGLKQYQLCQKIADVFDQYQVYRPDWINDWEQNKFEIDGVELTQHLWQPILWQGLLAKTASLHESPYHRANLHHKLISRITSDNSRPNTKPLFVFGISTLPQQQLDVFQAIATHREVYIFWCNPSFHYWGDIVDQKQASRLRIKSQSSSQDLSDYFDIGNPLLASWGKPGRDYLDMLIASNGQQHDEFRETQAGNMLEWIQSEAFELSMRQSYERLTAEELLSNGHQYPKIEITKDDQSLQVHICHSKVRELEVLHDHLLSQFAENDQLVPSDIVVMMPDVAAYAPYIEGVFGSVESNHFVPYGISDQNLAQESALVDSFLQLLELHHSRIGLSEVLSLLEVPAIQRRFELSEEEYQDIRFWLSDSGFRWGWDGEDKTRWDLPEDIQNTLIFGLQRLLVGYAMTGSYFFQVGSQHPHSSISPYHDIEGQRAAALGKLYLFALQLKKVLGFCLQPSCIEDKVAGCFELLHACYDASDDEQAYLNQLRQAIESVSVHQQQYPLPIKHDVFVAELNQHLQDKGVGQRFLAGAINFCTLMPMRSIPFKHVCLLGMDDNSYPRQTIPIGFDLVRQAKTRKGDRSRRLDDRYLFLEALLSARERLYISFQGISARDNSARNPSILVSELLDYCAHVFCLDSDRELPEQTTIDNLFIHLKKEHGLQPFDARYFIDNGSVTQSYQRHWRRVLETQDSQHQRVPFINKVLEKDHISEETCVELPLLVTFFMHPIKLFFKQRWGATLDLYTEEIEDEEPFTLSPLDKYQVAEQSVLASINNEFDADTISSHLTKKWRAEGRLANGIIGNHQLQKAFDKNRELLASLSAVFAARKQQTLEIDIQLSHNNTKIQGWTKQIYDDALIMHRPGKIRGKDRISLWINWLACCGQSGSLALSLKEAYFYGNDACIKLARVPQDEAVALLNELIALYYQGKSSPLLFFPETATAWLKHGDMQKTLETFNGNHFVLGEGQDLNIHRVCPDLSEYFSEFVEIAEQVLLPIKQYETKP